MRQNHRMRSSADLLNVESRATGGYVRLSTRCYTTNIVRDLALEQSAARLGWDGYSTISSALAKIDCGTSKLRAFAALRLTTNSSLVDCWTGKSAGLSPLRIRAV